MVMVYPLAFQMMYILELGGANTLKADGAEVTFNMAYTDWLLAAVLLGPLVYVNAYGVDATARL
jgi:hypothetical protein